MKATATGETARGSGQNIGRGSRQGAGQGRGPGGGRGSGSSPGASSGHNFWHGAGRWVRTLLGLFVPVVAALLVGALIVWALGHSPKELFVNLWWGAFGTLGNTLTTLRWSTPLILSGLAVTVAYRSGLLNMGGDGQIYAGALCAAIVGASWAAPMWMHLPAAVLAAAVGGALFSLIPALLRVYMRVNEIVTTLMFNYIGFLLTDYLVLALYYGGDSSRAIQIATPRVAATATIARFVPRYPLTWAIVIAAAIAVVAAVVFKRTVWGYEAESTGANPGFARYIGVPVGGVALASFLSSGAIAGIAGGLEILGTNRRFVSQFSTGLGFEGLLVALLGRTDPLGMIVAALFLGAVKNGFFAVERMTSIDRSMAIVLQAILLLFVSARGLVDLVQKGTGQAEGAAEEHADFETGPDAGGHGVDVPGASDADGRNGGADDGDDRSAGGREAGDRNDGAEGEGGR